MCVSFIDLAAKLMSKLKKINFNEVEISDTALNKIMEEFIEPEILQEPIESLI